MFVLLALSYPVVFGQWAEDARGASQAVEVGVWVREAVAGAAGRDGVRGLEVVASVVMVVVLVVGVGVGVVGGHG